MANEEEGHSFLVGFWGNTVIGWGYTGEATGLGRVLVHMAKYVDPQEWL